MSVLQWLRWWVVCCVFGRGREAAVLGLMPAAGWHQAGALRCTAWERARCCSRAPRLRLALTPMPQPLNHPTTCTASHLLTHVSAYCSPVCVCVCSKIEAQTRQVLSGKDINDIYDGSQEAVS